MLGVENMEILEPTGDGTGFGIVGNLAEPMVTEEFLRHLKSTLCCGAIRHSAITKSTVRRIAICTGAGSSMMSAVKLILKSHRSTISKVDNASKEPLIIMGNGPSLNDTIANGIYMMYMNILLIRLQRHPKISMFVLH